MHFNSDVFMAERASANIGAGVCYLKERSGSLFARVSEERETRDFVVYRDNEQRFPELRLRRISRSGNGVLQLSDVTEAAPIATLSAFAGEVATQQHMEIAGPDGSTIAGVVEDRSDVKDALRTLLRDAVPTSYKFYMSGAVVGTMTAKLSWLKPTYAVDFSADPSRQLDRRIVCGAVAFLLILENIGDV